MSAYSVSFTVWSTGATYTQTLDGDDIRGDDTAAYGLADPLTITQKLSADPRLPLSHPEPDECTFALIAPDSSTYAAMTLGDPMVVKLFPLQGSTGTPVTFWGRVAGMTADPHPLGVKLSVSCVDYTADLAEIPVGAVAYPAENSDVRLNRITDEARIPRVSWSAVPATVPTSPFIIGLVARAAGITDAYSLLRETMDSCLVAAGRDENGTVYAGTHNLGLRAYIVPRITNDQLDPVTPYEIRWGAPYTRRIAYAPPYRLANVAGVWTVQVSTADSSPATGTPTISAARVEFAPTFTQTKGGDLPNVTAGTDGTGVRDVWDWRLVGSGDAWAYGGPRFLGPPGVFGSPAIVNEVDSIVSAVAGPGTPIYVYRVPYPTDGLASWSVGTMAWQLWAESQVVYSWNGAANASTSTRRNNSGAVETNLHTDPLNATAGAATLGFVLNSGTIVRDLGNLFNNVPSLKVTTTVMNWGYLPMDGLVHNLVQDPPAPANGTTLTFRCVVKSDTAQTVWARQYGSGGPASGPPVTLVPNVWQPVTVTWTQAAGTGPFLSIHRQDLTPMLGNLWIALPMIVAAPTISDSPAWAPGYIGTPNVQWRRPQLTELLTVAGAQAGRLPNAREWVSGLVSQTVLALSQGRPVLNVDVIAPSWDFNANREQLGSSAGVVSLDSPILAGLTLSQLAARDTLNDYSLVRGS